MLKRFKQRGLLKARGKQRTDSTHVLAAVHDLNLLELVAETLRAALDDLAAVAPDWVRAVAQPAWFERYGRRIEEYHLPKSQDKRVALARQIGADGCLLLEALEKPTAPAAARDLPMVQVLRDVWRVHYAQDERPPRWRKTQELPPVAERMQSPYDPEAHFSIKRQFSWTGYKVHVTETCDDAAAHLTTDVNTCPSMQLDMASTAAIHERLAAKDLLPAEHFVDAAYVNADLLAQSQRDHGVALEGPVRGIAIRARDGFALTDFTIDWKAQQVSCPRGKKSVSWRTISTPSGPRIQAQFSRAECGVCAVRHSCTPPTSTRRQLQFHLQDEYQALHAARARMTNPEWLQRYHRRAGVEGTLSQGVRAFGMRRSRYIGLAKTSLQQACTAGAMNVSRVVHWLDRVPQAKTRTTRFAALAAVA